MIGLPRIIASALALFLLHLASARLAAQIKNPSPLAAQKQESSPLAAQEQESSAQKQKVWDAVARTCAATARKPPTEKASRIAGIARDEFYYFGGHKIDSNGRIFSFGVIESEQEENPDNIETYRLGHLGWWQVMRYWRLLEAAKTPDEAARNALQLRGFANATREPADKNIEPPISMDLARALNAIDAIPKGFDLKPEQREIMRQALIRAAINDVAWSAAFIGAVMRQAGLTPEEFDFADAHATYIYAAFASALAEAGGTNQTALYRACPTPAARPRPGDLVCYHRHTKQFPKTPGSEIRSMILADVAGGETKKTIRRSHCDVVVHTDTKAARVYVAGGNVQQAVTIKKLQLDRRTGTLREVQPDNCRLEGPWTFPQPELGKPVAPSVGSECTLNHKSWFIVLQAR
jgi:hypothetical protein